MSQTSSGGGLIGTIIFLAICWWGYNHFINHHYDKAWWSGSESQKVCVVHNPTNDNCYNLTVYASEGLVQQINFPNGGFVGIMSQTCGKAVTFEGRFCDVTDNQNRDWQINSN